MPPAGWPEAMSVQTKFFVAGMAELEKALQDLGSEIAGSKGGLVKNALLDAGRDVKDRMKANAPKDTGRLRRSIKHFREKNPRRLSEIVYVGPMLGSSRDDPNGAWYAAIVEFQGGAGGKGAGYARRAIHPEEDYGTIRKNLATGVERVAKKVGNENARAVGARIKKL